MTWSPTQPWRHGMMSEKRNETRVVARVLLTEGRGCSVHVYDKKGRPTSAACTGIADGQWFADSLMNGQH